MSVVGEENSPIARLTGYLRDAADEAYKTLGVHRAARRHRGSVVERSAGRSQR
jgi:hypothetical protein